MSEPAAVRAAGGGADGTGAVVLGGDSQGLSFSPASGRPSPGTFPYLLFADQLGDSPTPARTREGVRWARLVTDIPLAIVETLKGRMNPRAYVRSLRGFQEEAVFSREDPLPGIAEVVHLPYLYVKRGF
jgi:hypothetical protein